MTQHTGGHWHLAPNEQPNFLDTYTVFYGHGETAGNQICQCRNLGDARLIAAAPDLLAACELWGKGFAEGEEFTPDQLLKWMNDNRRAARAAIARAKGSQ